jgi:hypothetical protein
MAFMVGLSLWSILMFLLGVWCLAPMYRRLGERLERRQKELEDYEMRLRRWGDDCSKAVNSIVKNLQERGLLER